LFAVCSEVVENNEKGITERMRCRKDCRNAFCDFLFYLFGCWLFWRLWFTCE